MALFDPNQLDQLERGYQQSQAIKTAVAQAQQPQKSQVSGLKRNLINLGAMGGEIGAGILGAAFAVPTFGASVAGSFGAGAGIEALRRKALGEDQSLGASLLEGGLTALPGISKGVGIAYRAAKGSQAAAKTAVSMRALANKASQSGTNLVSPITASRSAARGFTSSLDAQGYKNFDSFYKDYGGFFKDQGFTRGDAQQIYQAAQKMPIGSVSTAQGGAVGVRPAASIQSQLEAAHNAGNKQLEQQLVSQLPSDQQSVMRSALNIPATAPKPSFNQQLAGAFKSNPEKGVAGKVTKAGQSLKAQARGVIPGLKPQGNAERLLPSQAKNINETLNKIGAKGAVPRQLRTVEAAQQKALGQIDSELNRYNVTLSPTARTNMATRFTQSITGSNGLGMTDAHRQLATDVSTAMRNAPTVKDQEQLRRVIDSRINFARNPNSPDPIAESIYKSARRTIDNTISSVTPGLKAAKTQYAALENAKDALVMSAPATLRQAGGMGVLGRIVSGGATQKALDVTGNNLIRIGKITGSPITKVGALQAVGRGILKEPDQRTNAQAVPESALTEQNALIQQLAAQGLNEGQISTELVPPEEQNVSIDLSGAFSPQTSTGTNMGMNSNEDTSPGIQNGALAGLNRSSSQLLADALATWQSGNPDGAKFLMSLASQQAELEKAASKGGLNADQRKAMGKVDTAENIANQIQQLLGTVGGGEGWRGYLTSVGAKLPGVASREKAYEAIRKASIGPLARAISGEVGVLTDRDIARVEGLLPKLTDTPQEAQMKLANLRAAIQSRKADISSLGGSDTQSSTSTDTTDLLSMLSQGQDNYSY